MKEQKQIHKVIEKGLKKSSVSKLGGKTNWSKQPNQWVPLDSTGDVRKEVF